MVDDYVWKLTDHVCRRCMGRILEAKASGRSVFRCSNCGAEGEGEVSSVCCCGMRTREITRRGEVVQMPRPVGLRCVRNPEPTPGFPSEVIAVVGD